jgi:hypothetical protein
MGKSVKKEVTCKKKLKEHGRPCIFKMKCTIFRQTHKVQSRYGSHSQVIQFFAIWQQNGEYFHLFC